MNKKDIVDFIITEGNVYSEGNRVNLSKCIQLHIENGTIIVLSNDSGIKAILTYRYMKDRVYVCDTVIRKDAKRSTVSNLLRELALKCSEANELVYEREEDDKIKEGHSEHNIYILNLNRWRKE